MIAQCHKGATRHRLFLLTIRLSLIQFSGFFFLFADPHIKVAGRLDDVRAAKEKIMEVLDTRVNFLRRIILIKFAFLRDLYI